MMEMFQHSFMRIALAAGLPVAAVAAYYGCFLVQRRMSFMGSGLAHASFGGIALALWLQLDPLVCGGIFTALAALGIRWLKDRSDLAGDTVIGVFFSASMAAGIVFVSFRREAAADAASFLFGNILLLGRADVAAAVGLLLLTILLLPLWGRWAYAAFDPELAATDSIAARRDDYLFHLIVALTIVVSVKLVGIVLVAAFLVVPPATARLVSRTFLQMTLAAMFLGVASVALGLGVSFRWDLPSGAVIVLTQCLMLLIALPLRTRDGA